MPKDQYLQRPGEYNVVVRKPESGWLGLAKEKQTPYIRLDLEVENDPWEDGKRIPWYGFLSDKALGYTVDTLVQCFGFSGDLDALWRGEVKLEGMRALITVEEESYNGKVRCKVKWLNPPGYVHEPKTLPPETAKWILAGLKSKVEAAAEASRDRLKQPKPPAQGQAVMPPAEDDVPF